MGEKAGGDPAHLWPVPLILDHAVGAAGEIYSDLDQGLIHGDERRSHAGDPYPLFQGLVESLSQGQGAVFHGVVFVDFKIAPGGQFEIEVSVYCQVGEHVVQETYPGIDLCLSVSVQIKLEGDFSFRGLALNGCFSLGSLTLSFSG